MAAGRLLRGRRPRVSVLTMSSRLLTVEPAHASPRLDRFVADHTGFSRSTVLRLIASGQVRIDGRLGKKGTTLATGQTVAVPQDAQDDLGTPPAPDPSLPLEVLYEDDDVVVVSKAPGQACHPLRADERGTCAHAVAARYPTCATASTPLREGGVCHRLDKETSGALLFAKTNEAFLALRADFSNGLVKKEYLALCVGAPASDTFDVRLPLLPGKHGSPKVRVAVTPEEMYDKEALDAHTHVTVLSRSAKHTLLRVVPHTGRRHQIRVHLSHLGLPILGDALYGEVHPLGHFLHALKLTFRSPSHPQKEISVTAPLPKERQALLSELFGTQAHAKFT